MSSTLGPLLVIAALGASVLGCEQEEQSSSLSATLKTDGYALFAVDNERQQRNDVGITVEQLAPGSTYVMLYSEGAPANVGWFLFDPSTTARCGGDPGPHCEVPGYGYLVDVATVPDGASSVTLRDARCGCDAKHDRNAWTGHWAVMRVDRPTRESRPQPLTVGVRAIRLRDFAREPEIRQLQ